MSKYYDINNLFDENGDPVKVTIDTRIKYLASMSHSSLVEHCLYLEDENQQLKKQQDDVVECCKNSIKSINDKLAWVDTSQTYPNEYRRIRLKAFRTKCKEILKMLGEIR